MIVKVNKDNEQEWARLCKSLFTRHEEEEFIIDRNKGLYQNEFLYYLDGIYIGFISLSIRSDYVEGTSSSPVAYVEGIYITKEYRKQGYGKELIKFAKKWAIENNCKELASDCELTNDESIYFHQKLGFTLANKIVCFTMKCQKKEEK